MWERADKAPSSLKFSRPPSPSHSHPLFLLIFIPRGQGSRDHGGWICLSVTTLFRLVRDDVLHLCGQRFHRSDEDFFAHCVHQRKAEKS